MNTATLKKYIQKNTATLLERVKKENPPFDIKKKHSVVLFGAAILGKEFLGVCKKNGFIVRAICDNDTSKAGKKIDGTKIISINELQKYPRDTQIIITIMHDFVVKKQLSDLGFTHVFSHTYFATMFPKKFDYFTWKSSRIPLQKDIKEILKLHKLLKDSQSKKVFEHLIIHRLTLHHEVLDGYVSSMESEYFDSTLIKKLPDEVFVDGGGFDGDTVKKYIHASKNIFKEIHCFEPDKHSQSKIKAYLKELKDERVTLHPMGLNDKNQTAYFTNTGTAGSKVTKERKNEVKLISLDTYLYKNKPTLIKFDIEGAETKAIMGMKKILKKFKPKLAICTYHKPSDLWKIPLLIKKINPKYNLYMRHYTQTQHDTVCYAL